VKLWPCGCPVSAASRADFGARENDLRPACIRPGIIILTLTNGYGCPVEKYDATDETLVHVTCNCILTPPKIL
jgi:hypothetical protein